MATSSKSASQLTWLEPGRLGELLGARGRRAPVTCLARVDSTQDLARVKLNAGAPHGTLVVAEEQTRGRGRHGRRWLSTPGGLTFSLVIRDAWARGRHWPVMAAAIGLARAVEVETRVSLQIKWPNDLLLRACKAGGLLVEAAGDAAILGVGLNVGASPGVVDGTPAISIAQAAQRPVDRITLVAALVATMLDTLAAPDTAAVRAEWTERSAIRGREVLVSGSFGRLTGRAEGFGPDGELLLRLPDGELRAIPSGEVSLRALGPD